MAGYNNKISEDNANIYYGKLLNNYNNRDSVENKISSLKKLMEKEILKEVADIFPYKAKYENNVLIKDGQHGWLLKNQKKFNNGKTKGFIPREIVKDIERLFSWRNVAEHPEDNQDILYGNYIGLFTAVAQTIKFFSGIDIPKKIKNICSNEETKKVYTVNNVDIKKVHKKEEFKRLCDDVNNCTRCERLKDREKNLSKNNGNLKSTVIFIAQAPGTGAKNTGYPLRGDPVGNNFEELLNSINWKRKDVFITNTILCNACDDKGQQTIGQDEIRNCKEYLKRTIELVNPQVIVTLGEKALNALRLIEKHHYSLRNHVANNNLTWNGKILFPLYLMTGRILNTIRNMESQKGDFKKLKNIVDKLKNP